MTVLTKLATIVLSALSLIPSTAPASAEVPPPPAGAPTACTQHPDHQAEFHPIPCGEIDRAVTEAAREFGIDEAKFRRVTACESAFRPRVVGAGLYVGLLQESSEFFRRWQLRFDHDPAVAVDLGQGMPGYTGPGTGAERGNPFHNARVAAYAIAHDGYSEWGRCRHR